MFEPRSAIINLSNWSIVFIDTGVSWGTWPVLLGDKFKSILKVCILPYLLSPPHRHRHTPSHRLGRVPPWQSYIRSWLIYLLRLVFQLSWWLMCFGYRNYSKSLGTRLMRLSSGQRMRWRKSLFESLPDATFCCIYLACPLQRQTHDIQWDLSLLQRAAVAPQKVWIIHIIVQWCASSNSEADAAPAVFRTSKVWWWNWETVEREWIFLTEQVVQYEKRKGRRGERSLSCSCIKKVFDLRCWEAFFCTSIWIDLTGESLSAMLQNHTFKNIYH